MTLKSSLRRTRTGFLRKPLMLMGTLVLMWTCGTLAKDALETGFTNPPDSAKPQTWWHWADGNIGREGITAELEALKRIGIGGVHMFTVGGYPPVPNPKVPCLSPAWHEMVRHAVKECDRLGLAFTVQNCAGWSTAGGPWITPDKGMQRVVFTRYQVTNSATLKLEALPSWPEKGNSFYRDIAVLAFPTPPVFMSTNALPVPKITGSLEELDFNVLNRKLDDIKKAEGLQCEVSTGKTGWIQFEFPTSVTCRSVHIAGSKQCLMPAEHDALVMASDDGKQFREICRLSTYVCVYNCAEESVEHAIPRTTARFFKLAWEGPAKLNLRRVNWSATPVINAHISKVGNEGRTMVAESSLPVEPDTVVPVEQITDLTDKLDVRGDLCWTAPPGVWTVLHIGYRNTGKRNAPAPPEASGLECDKFSRDVVSFHFDNYVGTIIRDAKEVGSRAVKGVLVDSWEAGTQNWSPVFREEFSRRRGYDVLNYLPAFAGFIVGSRDITERFLRDVRQTGSDLVSENFYGTLTDLAHKNRMHLYAESCGGCGAGVMVADGVQHYLYADIPMTEGGRPMKEAASAAHLTGKPVVAMEAFTQGGGANWNDSPSSLKSGGDAFMCAGINRIVFHTYAHNPDVTRLYPGPAFWKYGLPFSRGQTWWEQGRAWMTYLSRCQYLLQCGQAVADVLYFYGEEPAGPIPNVFPGKGRNLDAWTELPRGYDFDLLPAEFLINSLSVRKGQLAGPDGTSYKLLVLRNSDRMTPEAARKIQKLVKSGATILGPKPACSPSLSNYPECDSIVKAIGNEVWGQCDGKTIKRCDYGKGRIFLGATVKETLAAIELLPDFTMQSNDANADVGFIHRRTGKTDIYFLSNQGHGPVDIEAGFRIREKKPEIWDPVSGEIRDAISFRQDGKQTFLPLHFDRSGSVFVVFRNSVVGNAHGSANNNIPVCKNVLTVRGPWNVLFTPGWDALANVVFENLDDWSRRSEEGIKYYSGTAVYRKTVQGSEFGAPSSVNPDPGTRNSERFYLDLGAVQVTAEVKVNGVDCGIAWTPPYRVEITKAVKTGPNELEIRVANTWANRLIGDELLDPAMRRTWTTYHSFNKDSQLPRSGLLGPVSIQTVEE